MVNGEWYFHSLRYDLPGRRLSSTGQSRRKDWYSAYKHDSGNYEVTVVPSRKGIPAKGLSGYQIKYDHKICFVLLLSLGC